MEEMLSRAGKPLIMSFVSSQSGAGKTTLIEKLIVLLMDKGYRVGVLKHSAHRFEIDRKGKDSYHFMQAGASQVIIASSEKLGMVRTLRQELDIEAMIKLFEEVDFVLIEGFKDSGYPKIEIHRKNMGSTLLCSDPKSNNYYGIVAVASDEPVSAPVPVLDLNDAASIADWIGQTQREPI